MLAYVDDMDFCKKGTDDGSKMQEIVDYYSSMHEVTGGKVQKEKFMIFSWKWKSNKIVEVAINVIINGDVIKSINMKHIIKALGVYASPFLSWKDEFEHVKLKIKRSIKKLITADMKSHQVHLYFINCMLTNIFFGRGIVQFNKKAM